MRYGDGGPQLELLFDLGLCNLDHLIALDSIGTLMHGAYGTRILCHGDSLLHFLPLMTISEQLFVVKPLYNAY